MKSKEEFDSYYEKELKRKIEDLEVQRLAITEKYSYKRYWKNLMWLVILFVALVVGSIFIPAIPEQVESLFPFIIVYAIGAAIYIYVMRAKKFKPVKLDYQQTVITKIIAFVDPQLKYNHLEGISAREFEAGGLFGSYTSYKSEDLVYGNTNGMELRMSDINCTRRKSGSGKNSSSTTVTVFKGFYIISKLNEKIPAGVIIKPSSGVADAFKGLASSFLGSKLVNSIVDKFSLNDIEVGDAEFDKQYHVKSVSPEVAKELLTPRFIQLIKTFQQEANLPVSLSFFDSNVHIAFSGINLFEADPYTSFIEKDISKQYFNYLNLAYGVVEAIRASR
ncbi:MAG: DUF3137 domain-containing protein [Cyclobacteriaceae bacterium]